MLFLLKLILDHRLNMIMCVEHWILIQGRFAVVGVSFKKEVDKKY